ncbi:MAG: hypothetical protein WC584_00405 [Candidatus Pacearchaeota archaeon]
MKLLGFNFNKINVERFPEKLGELKINTNIDISDISIVETEAIKSKEELLGIKFNYIINYEPQVAKIEFSGNLLISLDSKITKDLLKKWENKEIPDDFRISLFNIIMRKSSIKALEFEEEMNLPYHIPMPVLKNPENSEKN